MGGRCAQVLRDEARSAPPDTAAAAAAAATGPPSCLGRDGRARAAAAVAGGGGAEADARAQINGGARGGRGLRKRCGCSGAEGGDSELKRCQALARRRVSVAQATETCTFEFNRFTLCERELCYIVLGRSINAHCLP